MELIAAMTKITHKQCFGWAVCQQLAPVHLLTKQYHRRVACENLLNSFTPAC
eukprot:c37408_g1_i1 orf=136-291(-)